LSRFGRNSENEAFSTLKKVVDRLYDAICSLTPAVIHSITGSESIISMTIASPQSLNTILTNDFYKYFHLVSDREAADFTDVLEQTLADGKYSDFDKCPFCGKAFAGRTGSAFWMTSIERMGSDTRSRSSRKQ